MFWTLRLAGGLAPVGPGAMRGALVSLGPYPGMIGDGRGLVRGTVFRVRDPAVFRRLDDYEGFDPARPEASLYRRVRVRLAGRQALAWVYVERRGAGKAGSVRALDLNPDFSAPGQRVGTGVSAR